MDGRFRGWVSGRDYGFIVPDDGTPDLIVRRADVVDQQIQMGDRVVFRAERTASGLKAVTVRLLPTRAPLQSSPDSDPEGELLSDDVEDLDGETVDRQLLVEISRWKREAKSEDNDRYFWHVREVDQIARGEKYFVIGRKGSGKTAICEYFNRQQRHDVFAEKLSFKNFPFNELYSHNNLRFTPPNQYITIWKYLIYSTVCRLLLRNEAVDGELRRICLFP